MKRLSALVLMMCIALMLGACSESNVVIHITADPFTVIVVTEALPTRASLTSLTPKPTSAAAKVTPIAPTNSAPSIPSEQANQPTSTNTAKASNSNPSAPSATSAVIFVPPTNTETPKSANTATTAGATSTASNQVAATPTNTSTSTSSFNADAQEQGVAVLAATDPNQHRAALRYNPILARVARERAKDLATRKYFSHTNPDGIGPNYLVRQAGYPLPTFYSSTNDANNIESLAAGNATPQDTWQQWLNSPPHRQHVLGEIGFYAEQIDYGIGYYYDPSAPYVHYWVFISARTDQVTVLPTLTFTPNVTKTFTPSATNTQAQAAATATKTFTASATNAQAVATATKTFTAIAPSATNTVIAPSATNTTIPPSATSVPPTATKTFTPVPPTATNVPPTFTKTSPPPTFTFTPVASCPSLNSGLEAQILVLVNNERTSRGLAALTSQPQLVNAARNHSISMACQNFFSHTGLDGSSPFDRMKREGYSYSYAGENIAAGYADAASVVAGWMNSPGHRDNILNPNFTQIGVGYAYGANSSYGHYHTNTFGKP